MLHVQPNQCHALISRKVPQKVGVYSSFSKLFSLFNYTYTSNSRFLAEIKFSGSKTPQFFFFFTQMIDYGADNQLINDYFHIVPYTMLL